MQYIMKKKMILSVLIGQLIFVSCSNQDQKKDQNTNIISNEDLRQELLSMEVFDQEVSFAPEIRPLTATIIKKWELAQDSIYRLHCCRLKEILNQSGFPGIDMVGKDASSSFWLMVQHCDFDILFQKRVLEAMKFEVGKGNASSRKFARLTDRVMINQGKKQMFGTQVSYNKDGQAFSKELQDLQNVDKYRLEVGLDSIFQYLNILTTMHFEMNKDNLIKKGIIEPDLYNSTAEFIEKTIREKE